MARDKVFISYSRKDEKWVHRFVSHLKVLEREGLLGLWMDSKIKGGQDWYRVLNTAMLEARVSVLLISHNFLTSDFIRDEEIPRLYDCHCEDGMRIVPVILLPCTWEAAKWVSRMQVLPQGGQPLAEGNKIGVEKKIVRVAYDILDIYENWDPAAREAGLCAGDSEPAVQN